MTHETFAEYVHVSVRAVYYWQQRPDGVPKIGVQDLLNKALEAAPEQVKARFALLIEAGESDRATTKPNHPSAELDPEQQERIRGVINAPSRLDSATVKHLTQALYGQRHAEDSLGSDLRKFPVRNVRVLHSVVDLPPGGSFPLWNTAKDFFVMENPWMKNLDVTRR